MTMQDTWAQRLLRGALAGLAGGGASAVVLWIVVEPVLGKAIALESGQDAAGHDHGAHSHESGETVTRLQQQIGGTITVLLVAALVGLAFAVVYVKVRHRLPGATDLGKSLALGAFAFTTTAAVPALLVPANPPGVGDPATVSTRTLAYFAGIALGMMAIAAVFAISRALTKRGVSVEMRWLVTAGAEIVMFGAILAFGPHVYAEIPHSMPASIVWHFRVGSLGQLVAMWLLIGVVHGTLQHRSATRMQEHGRSVANA